MCEVIKGSTDICEIQGELLEAAGLLRQLYVSMMQWIVRGIESTHQILRVALLFFHPLALLQSELCQQHPLFFKKGRGSCIALLAPFKPPSASPSRLLLPALETHHAAQAHDVLGACPVL